MNIVQQTAALIQKVTQYPDINFATKHQDAGWLAVALLEERLEYNSKLTFEEDNREAASEEDVGKAASLLLEAIVREKDGSIRALLLEVLVVAIENNDIYMHVDFKEIINLLPHLSFGLADAIAILGYSHKEEYIALLESYLNEDEGVVFDAICQIWWDVSGRNQEVEQLLKRKEIYHISFQLDNLKKQHLSEYELKKQYNIIRNEVLKNMKTWFKQHKNL